MAAGPIPGRVFLAPTSAAVGGTQVRGLFEDSIGFDDGTLTEHYGAGLESDNWTTVRTPSTTPPKLILPIRDQTTQGFQLLLSLLSDGASVHSSGGVSTAVHGTPPSVILAVRPKDTTQKYLYGPRWYMHRDTVKRITWHRNLFHFDGASLELAPSRSLDHTLRAFMLDTPANIDAHYSLP